MKTDGFGNLRPDSFPILPNGWVDETETFSASCGSLKLFAVHHHRREPGAGAGRGLLVIHGQGEHGGRYGHVPHFLEGEVDSIYCPDHRGHGRSEGLRGHVDRFDRYAEDVAIALDRHDAWLRARFGAGAQLHVLGHSMGGLVALRMLRLNPDARVASVTISAPLIGLNFKVPLWKKAVAYGISRVWGALQMPTDLDPAKVSRDPDVQEVYKADRLIHDRASAGFFTDLQAVLAEISQGTQAFRIPIQFLVPLADEVVSPKAALEYFERIQAPAKRLRTYEGFRHEPFNELGKETVFADLASWIAEHGARAGAGRAAGGRV